MEQAKAQKDLEGHRDLIEFFISQGANDCNRGMYGAAVGGKKDSVEFFISQGANDWNLGMHGAAIKGHKDLIEFFISQGDHKNSFPSRGNN